MGIKSPSTRVGHTRLQVKFTRVFPWREGKQWSVYESNGLASISAVLVNVQIAQDYSNTCLEFSNPNHVLETPVCSRGRGVFYFITADRQAGISCAARLRLMFEFGDFVCTYGVSSLRGFHRHITR